MASRIEDVVVKPKWEIRAECSWAQRSHPDDQAQVRPFLGTVFLTIDLPNVSGASSLDLQAEYLIFTAQAGLIGPNGVPVAEYLVDIKFFRPIDPAETKISFTATSLVLFLRKKALDKTHWPRLRLATNDVGWLRRHETKWLAEDEQKFGDSLDGPTITSINTPGLGRSPPMRSMSAGKRKARRKPFQ